MSALFGATPAWATNCPGIYNGAPADAGGANDICTVDGSGYITCDLEANGFDSGVTEAHGYFVLTATAGREFLGYGRDAQGALFCVNLTMAASSAQCERQLEVNGSSRADDIKLADTTQGWSMNCSVNTVYGSDGEDDIRSAEAADTLNYLYGGGSVDLLRGYAGIDILEGDDSNDLLWGGGGDDTLYGGNGDDKLKGEGGDDFLYGDAQADQVCGGAGNDYVHGGDDAGDEVTGEAGTDASYGGGGAGDNCETTGYDPVTCESRTLTTCPW